MKGKTYEEEQMNENTKREGAQDESGQARSPKSEEEWMPKEVNEMRRPEAYEIHPYSWRGDRVRYGAAHAMWLKITHRAAPSCAQGYAPGF